MPLRHATLRQLQVFEAAARLQSFARAAAELHLTQPGISMQIKELEGHAGAPLFERIGRSMHVTQAGRTLLRHAHDVRRALQDAQEALDAHQGLRAGTVDVGVTSTAKYFAPQLIARFRAQHPGIVFRLAVNNREAVVDALGANAMDLAIMGRPPQALATVADAFAPHPFGIIAAPDHPLARRRRLPLAALADETFLVREQGSGTRSAMEQFFAEQRVAIRAAMEMTSNETIKQAVMAGLGVSFLSRHTIGLELESGRLVLLDVRKLPVMRQWFVVHLAAKRLSPMAAAFRAFVLRHGPSVLRAM